MVPEIPAEVMKAPGANRSVVPLLLEKQVTWSGAVTASVMFELTRVAYAAFTEYLSPSTIYTGVLYTIVSVVFWVYYAAIIFLIGGEVARVYEIRNANRVTV